MSKNTYDIGDLIVLSATFTDPDTGEGVEPGEVTCFLQSSRRGKDPIEVPVTDESDGVYTAEAEPTEAGEWFYRFTGTSPHQAAEEGVFKVRNQRVNP